MAGGGGFERQSSLSGAQKPVAQAAFEVFSHNLGKELPAFPGSQAIDPFTPQQVGRDFRQTIGDPLNQIFQENLIGGLRPDARGFAQERLGQVTDLLGAQFGRQGEQQALQEFLRTQPETGPALGLAQAFLGQPQQVQFQQPNQLNQFANAGLAGVNALGTASALGAFGGPITQSGTTQFDPAAAQAAQLDFNQLFPAPSPGAQFLPSFPLA